MNSRLLRSILSVILAAFLVAIVVYAYRAREQPAVVKEGKAPSQSNRKSGRQFGASVECKECHADIYNEWLADEHAGARFHPLLPWDPTRTECTSCHAPKPVFETGLEKMAELRPDFHDEGVDCLACHKNGETMAAASLRPGAAECEPIFDSRLKSAELCSPCHALHGSYTEWRATEFAAKGITCQDCHMPPVKRPAPGGQTTGGYSHKFRDGNDLDFLREAVSLIAAPEGDKIVVKITNKGAGHNIPAEISNRELFCLTTVYDRDGVEKGRFRESFKAPDRLKRATIKSSQIPYGATASFAYNPGCEHGKAVVELRYKRQSIFPADSLSVLIYELTVDF